MTSGELISRFLEETQYGKLDDTLFILAYGSRIMGTDNANSDLDILIVTSKNNSYKRAMFVDGIPIDITLISLDDIEKNIYKANATNSTYYHSIFKHGVVVKDKLNTFETLQHMLNKKVKRKKNLDGRLIEQALYHIKEFINTESNIHYYKALELLRRLHHVNNNCSNIRFTKVYDLYHDKKKSEDLYMLKLPDDEYIDKYLQALDEENTEKRLEFLMSFYHEFDNAKFRELEEKFYLDEDEIRKALFDLNNAIWKCEDLLLQRHPYGKKLYYMLIDDIYSLYELIYGVSLEHFDIESDDLDTLIDNLENLFCKLDENYRFDYNDVILKL